jgi:hypothetical protein
LIDNAIGVTLAFVFKETLRVLIGASLALEDIATLPITVLAGG